MAERHGTSIGWTHGSGYKGETWNPTTGCDRVSPGCANCYALTLAARMKAMGQPAYKRDGDPRTSGPGFGLTMHPDRLHIPIRWRAPRMVFVNSMSDLFHEQIEDHFLDEVFGIMAATRIRGVHGFPGHVFQVLTKRPDRALEYLAAPDRLERMARAGCQHFEDGDNVHDLILDRWPIPNVWVGVSVENSRFTWRADVLRRIPAAVRFVSAEPLLGSLYENEGDPVHRRDHGQVTDDPSPERGPDARGRAPLDLTDIDQVIVGGESGGRDARPMHPDWAREIRDHVLDELYAPVCCGQPEGEDCCQEPVPSGTRPSLFFKQWGSWEPCPDKDGAWGFGDGHPRCWVTPSGSRLANGAPFVPGNAAWMRYAGATPKAGGKELDGEEWCEIPSAGEPVAA